MLQPGLEGMGHNCSDPRPGTKPSLSIWLDESFLSDGHQRQDLQKLPEWCGPWMGFGEKKKILISEAEVIVPH